MGKLSLEKIKEELLKNKFIYIEGEYKNLNSPLLVECQEKHQFLTTLLKIRKNNNCPICEQYKQINNKEVELVTLPKKMGRRVLAIDNATHKTGYAIFENGKYLAGGIKQIEGNKGIILRIAELKQWLIGIILLWEIDVVGLEQVQLQQNPQTLITLSKLLGVLENASYELLHKEPYIVPSATWKSFCGIKGKNRQAQKEGAQNFVKKNFNLVASSDLSDAICIGTYVCGQERFEEMVTW